MRLARSVALLLLVAPLGGCWVTGAEVQGKIDAIPDQDVPGSIDIQSVDPAWGTAAGGSAVTVTASPVGQGAIVRIGGSDATVLSVSGDAIAIQTPAGTPGPADVQVQWGAKSGTDSGAFQYFADGSGQYGAIGAVSWVHIVGSILKSSNDDSGFAWVNFTEPSGYDYSAFYGTTLDTCQSGWTFPGTITEITDATEVDLSQEQGTGLTLSWNDTYQDFETDLDAPGTLGPSPWVSHATYDLDPLVGVTDFPPITMKSFVRTPGPFDVSVVDLTGSETSLDVTGAPEVGQSDLEIDWDTSDPGDYVLLDLVLYGDSTSPDPTEDVRCLVTDDGSFVVPSNVWTTTPDTPSELDLWVGRAMTSSALLPHDASSDGVAGVYWVVGGTLFFPF